MTIQQAAQWALQVQDAPNLSGVVKSLASPVIDALWEEARKQDKGTRWVAQHPIVTMFLLKMCELNGCGSTLHESYGPAEKACQELAAQPPTKPAPHAFDARSIEDDCKVCGERFAVHTGDPV